MSRVARRPTEFARTAMSARTRDRDDLAARSMLRGASPRRTTASITEAGGGTQEERAPRDLVAGGAHSPPEKRGPVGPKRRTTIPRIIRMLPSRYSTRTLERSA